MPGQDPTQKQISEKYRENLQYFSRGHYLRRLKTVCFLVAVVGAIAAAVGFRFWGSLEDLSTGPISQNHARFANDCAACHEGADTDLLNLLPLSALRDHAGAAKNLSVTQVMQKMGEVGIPDLEAIKAGAGRMAGELQAVDGKKVEGAVHRALGYTSLSLMDKACLKCHQPMGLHQPQLPALAVRNALAQLPLVRADECSNCHREHIGSGKMRAPDSQTCVQCHNDPHELSRTRDFAEVKGGRVPTVAENRNLGDGVVRFLAPPPREPVGPFKSYAEGHPGFAYEGAGLKDPARIKYNHARHELADIPKVNGRKLECADCHKPSGNGAYYQPVRYEKHCQTCHSLHLTPDLPSVKIPHGDSDKVRDFLRPSSLTLHITEALRLRGVDDRMELGRQIKEQFDNLAARGMTTAEEIERRVFYVGDPPVEQERNSPRSNKVPFFAACAKCHELEPGGKKAPRVLPTLMAERWVQRGPFTHVPHTHMDCLECHGAAKTSKLTTDILMPSQKSCAECHRPLDPERVEASAETIRLRSELEPGNRLLAQAQRKAGGVKSECLDCHPFHSSPSATLYLKGMAGNKSQAGHGSSAPAPAAP